MNTAVQKDEYMEINLFDLAGALWHRAWAIVLTMLLCGIAAFLCTYFLITPKYTARALMYVNNSSISVGSTSVSLSDLSASQTLVDTYIVILKTRLTLNEVIEQAELPYSYEDLLEMIHASAVNSTEIFEVNVTSPDPAEAERIANTIVHILPEKISEIMDGSSARTVDFAVQPTEKSSPSITKNVALGMIFGMVLSCGIIILLELVDEHIRGEEDLTQSYDLPVLAVVPDLIKSGESSKYGYSRYYASGKESK